VTRAIARASGPVVLVGHSGGGFVITEAGNDPRVGSLVYVAALAPDIGDSGASLGAGFEPPPLFAQVEVADGYVWLKRAAMPFFAGDLDAATQELLHATQGPANAALLGTKLTVEPAWKRKPSHFLLATADGAVNPDLQRAMAHKMNASVTEVASSHVPMLSHPASVLAMIREAASGL
jgi:pimeloyl-ACP methyl ester carboxylesterase